MNDVAKNVQYDISPVLLEGANGRKFLKHAIYKRSEENRDIEDNFPDVDDFGTSNLTIIKTAQDIYFSHFKV
jgi:hypothetical protein